MIGAAKGYRVRLCVPENVTPERKRILRAFGADVVFTDHDAPGIADVLAEVLHVRGHAAPDLEHLPFYTLGYLAHYLNCPFIQLMFC